MTGIWTAPVETNRALAARGLDAYPSSTGEVLGAIAHESAVRSPLPGLFRTIRRASMQDPGPMVDEMGNAIVMPPRAPVAMLDAARANAEYGIPGELSFGEDVAEPIAEELHRLKRDELARRDVMARRRGGAGETLGGFAVGLGVTALDPINLASAFVPVVGQARWLAALRATSGLERFGARAALGAIEGAAGAALVEPIVYGVARQEQADYGAVDSLLNLAFGAALGGGLHSIGGAIGDRLGWTRIAREELAARGEVPGAAATAEAVLHPERERAARTALSQMADGRPVDVTGALDADDRFERWKPGDPWPAEIEEARARAEAIPATKAIATPEREELRAGIVRALYGRGAAFKQREAWIVLGLPASGKSGEAVDLARRHGALVIDSDLAKARLPEYADGIGAAAVHEESDAIAGRILARAIGNGDNIVLPRVGRTAASIDRILALLQNEGYAINLRFVDLPPEKSVRRAMRRFREEGRFVDPRYVAEVGEAPRQTFEALKHDPRVKTWSEFSNDVPRGQAARPVAAGRNQAPDLLRDNGGRGEGGDRAPGRDDRGVRAQAPGPALDLGVAHTTSGTALKVRYRVVDAGDLVTSHNLDLAENPAFPPGLQPRERGRAAAGEQVQKIAAELNPELLAHSPLASEGAPIVGPDLVVESGNGRTLAIRLAYARALASADRYRAHLRQLGFDLQGLRAPILVRERLTELTEAERRQFVLDANVAGVARFSAAEQAMADAGRLRGGILDLYRGGAVDAGANRDFARAFVDALPPAERGPMVDAEGRLSVDGKRRLEAALLARAYGDAGLLAKILEAADSEIRAIAGALIDAAGPWAKMRAAARAGEIEPAMDVTADLLAAVRLVERARRDDQAVRALADQIPLIGDELTPQARGFLGMMFADEALSRPRPRQAVAEDLRHFVDQAMLTRPGPTLFGDRLAPVRPEEILGARAAAPSAAAAPAARPALPDEVPPVVFRGSGRADRAAVYASAAAAEPVLGPGAYYAFTREAAARFGPTIEERQVDFGNPLVIRSDDEWRALTRRAGWEFPNPFGKSASELRRDAQALQATIAADGHDAVIVAWDAAAPGDRDRHGHEIKTLRKVFGQPQVFVPEPPRAAAAEGAISGQAPAGKDIAGADRDIEQLVRSGVLTADDPEIAALQALDRQAAAEGEAYAAAAQCLSRGA